MRILIVLLVALLFAVLGGFIAGSMVDSLPERPARVAGEPRDRDREIADAMATFNSGAEIARQRQRNVPIGAGVGLVVGLGVGAFVASRLSGRKAS